MPDTMMPDGTTLRFGIGQPVRRQEDPVLLTGRGRYSDDISLPGEAHAVIVRSPYAHGVLRGIDTTAARAMPGVLGIYTAEDVRQYGTLRCTLPFRHRDGSEMKAPERHALAEGKVRFVGDPLACVVAATRTEARDAAEAVLLDVEPLPAVTDAAAAAAPGAPTIYEGWPGNVVLDFHFGDAAKVAEAFRRARHVARLPLRNNRIVVCAMEPRAAIAEWDEALQKFTLHVGCQGVFGLRAQMAGLMGVPVERFRVLSGNV
ncbi:MAG: xanthine dehydrogenase family protein molybdopterin-binding subunit, partial [Acetobacteraceae bacterium]|nr:xanthine dehydrogenase family protein molybdopterin-binding subunit [Acetobacteraceae bacterium]